MAYWKGFSNAKGNFLKEAILTTQKSMLYFPSKCQMTCWYVLYRFTVFTIKVNYLKG